MGQSYYPMKHYAIKTLHERYERDGDVSIEDGQIIVNNNVIYINPNFEEIVNRSEEIRLLNINHTDMPVAGRHYHIFINDETTIDLYLASYVAMVRNITGRPAIIHIPKTRPFCKLLAQQLFGKSPNWVLVYDELTHPTDFRIGKSSKLGGNQLMLVWWHDHSKVHIEFVEEMDGDDE